MSRKITLTGGPGQGSIKLTIDGQELKGASGVRFYLKDGMLVADVEIKAVEVDAEVEARTL